MTGLSRQVLPMYMGVIPTELFQLHRLVRAPHVYGGDPTKAH